MKKRKAGRPRKSIGQWLDKLPEPYRSQAIKNTELSVLDAPPHISNKNLADVLFSSFVFNDSPEGGDYWNEFYKSLKLKD